MPAVFALKRHVEQRQETGRATATTSAHTQIREAARACNKVRLKEDEVAVYDLFDDGALEAREHDMRATFEQSLRLESAKDPFMEALRALIMGVPMKGGRRARSSARSTSKEITSSSLAAGTDRL